MKFVSFNINGLRARLYQLEAIIDTLNPDIIGLQETKVHNNDFPLEKILSYGYYVYYHGQKSHYGVALLSKKKPLDIRCNFSTKYDNVQCRIIIADFITSRGVLTVINCYFPQGENRDHPIKFLAKKNFYKALQIYLEKNYHKQSMLLIMGDMNISPTDLDVGIGEKNRKRWLNSGKCSFLPEERVWMERLLSWGLIDAYRQINPLVNNRYSWFSYRSQCFDKNQGLRVDLLLCSQSLSMILQETDIDYKIRAMEKPSDHAPVWADFFL